MAKKKNIVIVDKELTPTVLYVRADKKKTSILSVLWVVIIFAVLLLGVYFLPNISVYVNNYLNPEPVVKKPVTKPTIDDDKDKDKEDVKEYNLIDNPVIETDNFDIKNIVVVDNVIKFDIVNKTDSILELNNLKYFMTLFNDHKRLLQRIMINDGVVSPGDVLNLSFDLKDASVSIISLLEINTIDYPAYSVKEDESGNAKLVCKKDKETVNFLFSGDKLFAIQDVYLVPSTDSEYLVLYSTYQALAGTYNAIEGVTSSVVVNDNMMNFTTLYNLNSYVGNAIKSKILYPKDTDAKIIKFELDASGYECG